MKKRKKVMFLYVVSALFLVILSHSRNGPNCDHISVICCSCFSMFPVSPPTPHFIFSSVLSFLLFSAWHHHCLREHCSSGLRSRCPYVYRYEHLSTAAVNISLAAAFKESN